MVDTRWCVTYTTFVNSRKKAKHKGSMVLRADVSRIVLYDQDNHVVDVRPLHAGELMYHGSVVHFPSHIVDVGERITPSRGINRRVIHLTCAVTWPGAVNLCTDLAFYLMMNCSRSMLLLTVCSLIASNQYELQ
jgi:hypothetical protein